MTPFATTTRTEMLRRDRWTCQASTCIGELMNIGPLNWGRGWNVNAAHYPNMHQKEVDKNDSHGRCLCVHCHIIEEIERGNHQGASLLYQNQTIRNKEWLTMNGWVDQKPSMFWYYDFVRADLGGKMGLIQSYKEQFRIDE